MCVCVCVYTGPKYPWELAAHDDIAESLRALDAQYAHVTKVHTYTLTHTQTAAYSLEHARKKEGKRLSAMCNVPIVRPMHEDSKQLSAMCCYLLQAPRPNPYIGDWW